MLLGCQVVNVRLANVDSHLPRRAYMDLPGCKLVSTDELDISSFYQRPVPARQTSTPRVCVSRLCTWVH